MATALRAAWTFAFAGTAAACAAGDCPSVDPPQPGPEHQALLDPSSPMFATPAPDTFRVRFETTEGDVEIEVYTAWAPIGATRFYHLARNGFYDGSPFFRVVPGFVAPFGVNPIPAVQRVWHAATLPDDSVRASNVRYTVTFAHAGENTRTTQLFINYGDNSFLDADGFAPIGRVMDGSGVLLRLNSSYGDLPPRGNAPSYSCMLEGGGAFLERRYPDLDRIERTVVIEPTAPGNG